MQIYASKVQESHIEDTYRRT